MWDVWVKRPSGWRLLLSDLSSYSLAERLADNASDLFDCEARVVESGEEPQR